MAKSPENNSQESDNDRDRELGPSDESRLQSRITRLLKAANQEAPELDTEFLQRLEEETTKVFLESHGATDSPTRTEEGRDDSVSNPSDQSDVVEPANDNASDSIVPNPQIDRSVARDSKSGRNRMFVFAWRVLAAMLAGVAIWLGFSLSEQEDNSLGAALDRTAAVSTMQLNLTRASFVYDVVATGSKIRLASTEKKYEIGNNEATWLVDEVNSRVTAGPAKYFDESGKLNLLSLMDEIPAKEFVSIRNIEPVGDPVTFAGVKCRRYQSKIDCGFGRCGLVAFVEIKTGLLRQMELLPPRNDPDRGSARLNLVAWGQPLDESLFAISDKLTPEGRIGTVATVQGLVSLRPVMRRRWSLVRQDSKLETGDQVRTGPWGANAFELQLKEKALVTVGPGSLIEMVSANCIRLVAGELRINAEAGKSLTLNGPGDEMIETTGSAIYRVTMKDGKQTLSKLELEPKWLAGFEGTSNYDPTGSLVATIDGRNVPLTVGYHKVTVDIRDQIARTVIEQSFVNHTDSQLEGVFYFPLPQDASISGFGMWINGELVEADVVEKQRAREIYETILREKRDPGLLEWTGGNIFKARVFPILGRSEKRIKITYTQVLPRKGQQYVYHYGLQSEMLRQNPLRDLSINVKINSAISLGKVDCPTHDTRDSLTDHSAQLEFSAQQYTPERDFEVAVDVIDGAPPVVAIPHRRGDDGYMLLQITPPGSSGGWTNESVRDLTAEGEPLEMLIIADTSASMDENARKQQADFIAALLSLLSTEDRVNIAVADVDSAWQYDGFQPAGQKTAAETHKWLSARESLGWTNLVRTFESVLDKTNENTQIIYVGDGMVSTYVTEGFSFVSKLKRMFADKGNTMHSVSVGNSFESLVLKGMGAQGGGSTRQVSGTRTPIQVAGELLGEIANPAIRDLKIEFDGVRVAQVYPESLPNLSEGKQQILIGRYLPQGNDQTGTVRISGTRGDKPVSWSAPLKLKDAESGNSFIPRLWARAHLDYLLRQGSAPEIQEQIIALSEEFHIITPFTSLLVLESDADRERFGVQRRYLMRDGERFFADGRDNANYELIQKQMRLAGTWRVGIQKQLLRYFATLGHWPVASDHFNVNENKRSERNVAFGGGGYYEREGIVQLGADFAIPRTYDRNVKLDWGLPGDNLFNPVASEGFSDFDNIRDSRFFSAITRGSLSEDRKDRVFNNDEFYLRQQTKLWVSPAIITAQGKASRASKFEMDGRWARGASLGSRGWNSGGRQDNNAAGTLFNKQRTSFATDLFPTFVDLPVTDILVPPKWPEDVRNLVDRVMRYDSMSKLNGVEVQRNTVHYETLRGTVTAKSDRFTLYRPGAWLNRTIETGNQTRVDSCDGTSRTVVASAFELGRRRDATPDDRNYNPIIADRDSFEWLLNSHQKSSAHLKDAGNDESVLILRFVSNTVVEILIDTKRNVVISIVQKNVNGETTGSRTFLDYVNVGGIWWPQKIQHRNQQEFLVRETAMSVRELEKQDFDTRFAEQKPDEDQVLVIVDDRWRTLRSATQAIADARGTIADHLVRLGSFFDQQRWPKVDQEMDAIKRLAGRRRGAGWLELKLLAAGRQRENLRQLIIQAAENVVEASNGQSGDALFLARHLENYFGYLQIQEQLELHSVLKPAFEQSPLSGGALLSWDQTRARLLRGAGEQMAELEILKRLAQLQPFNYSAQTMYVDRLFPLGLRSQAYSWLERVIDQGPNPEKKPFENPDASRWSDWQLMNLLEVKINHLQQEGRYADSLQICEQLIADQDSKAVSQSIYGKFLNALVQTDDLTRVDESVAAWLAQVGDLKDPVAGKAPAASESSNRARIKSAIQYALGDSNQSSGNLDPKWVEPLANLVRASAQVESQHGFASTVLNHRRFQKLDINKTIRGELIEILEGNIETLSPELISFYYAYGVLQLSDSSRWKRLADRLLPVWESEVEKLGLAKSKFESEPTTVNRKKKERLEYVVRANAGTLISLYSRVSNEAHVNFLRKRIELAIDETQKTQAIGQLFNKHVADPWNLENENESFVLMAQMVASKLANQPRGHLRRVNLLFVWAEAMERGRRVAATGAINNEDGNGKKKTPAELAQEQKAATENSADQFINVLLTKEQSDAVPDWLKTWVRLERNYREVRRKKNYDQIRMTCREILGEQPVLMLPEIGDPDSLAGAWLDEARRQRALMTLLYLGSMRAATEQDRQWLSRYIDRATIMNSNDVTIFQYEKTTENADSAGDSKEGPEEKAFRQKQQDLLAESALVEQVNSWKLTKFQWMIATDQTDDLLEVLKAWAESDDGVQSWRHALALLQAERGEIETAIKNFEKIESEGELTAGDYRLLAGWFLVADRRADYERAKIASYDASSPYQLQNFISQVTQRVRNTSGSPDDMDEDVLFAIRSLMSRAEGPTNHIWAIRELYRETRDFRVLAALADALMGHSARGIYPQLNAWTETSKEIRDEATADSILERIQVRRPECKTVADQRALDLLESVIERRNSEIENQPGPHIEKAAAAMRRAFERKWEIGERALMAQWLEGLGKVPSSEIQKIQLGQLDALLAGEPDPENSFGANDRLKIAHSRAKIIGQYGEIDKAIDDLVFALDEYRNSLATSRGDNNQREIKALIGQQSTHGVIVTIVNFQKQLGRCAAAEKLLQRLFVGAGELQKNWLNQQLDELYLHALKGNVLVSLGQGEELYTEVRDRFMEQLDASQSEDRRHYSIRMFCGLFEVACRPEKPYSEAAKADFLEFASERMPISLEKMTNYYINAVHDVASKLQSRLGYVEAIQFFIERHENQPPRIRRTRKINIDFVGSWNSHVKDLPPDLDKRLLAIVIENLTVELQTLETHHGAFYRKHYSYYWQKHEDAFAAAAETVWQQNQDSDAHATFIARYLFDGLKRYDAAIELLDDAYRRNVLGITSQFLLVQYLMNQKRFDETIEILKQLVASKPDMLSNYTGLMMAYFETGNKVEFQKTVSIVDKKFNTDDAPENQLAALARICLQTGLDEQAADYYSRAIEKRRSYITGADQTLANYYISLSQVHTRLGNLQQALDAANAAIVGWGNNFKNRAAAIKSLSDVVASVQRGKFKANLDGLVEMIDRQESETGTYNYLLRNAIGKTYLNQKQYKQAITQLRLAVELQPNDVEIHNALIQCYDGAKDEVGAVGQLLELARLNRRDIKIYSQLGQRLAKPEMQKQFPGRAERAFTSMVEMLPAESEGHAALAEIRQNQNRWDEAVKHWSRVAEIRSKEPTGLVKLCEAQIHLGRKNDAQQTYKQLKSTTWPARFGDVENESRKLEERIRKLANRVQVPKNRSSTERHPR